MDSTGGGGRNMRIRDAKEVVVLCCSDGKHFNDGPLHPLTQLNALNNSFFALPIVYPPFHSLVLSGTTHFYDFFIYLHLSCSTRTS